MLLFSIAPVLALATLARAVVGPGKVTGNTAVHDPSMCKSASGQYFVFCQCFAVLPRIRSIAEAELSAQRREWVSKSVPPLTGQPGRSKAWYGPAARAGLMPTPAHLTGTSFFCRFVNSHELMISSLEHSGLLIARSVPFRSIASVCSLMLFHTGRRKHILRMQFPAVCFPTKHLILVVLRRIDLWLPKSTRLRKYISTIPV
jgi:hypothetical protein